MAGEADTLERWFAIADANRDGRIEGTEAITFFQRSGLPRETLKEVRGNAMCQNSIDWHGRFGAKQLGHRLS